MTTISTPVKLCATFNVRVNDDQDGRVGCTHSRTVSVCSPREAQEEFREAMKRCAQSMGTQLENDSSMDT